MKSKKKIIIEELKEHIPFTALATLIAVVIITLTLNFSITISHEAFEILHPMHVIFSAFVTAAIFYKYKKKILPAILMGIIGSILIGTLSDVILPWFEANLLLLETHLHLPIIESPLIIIGAALIGSLAGIFINKTKLPHIIHVFLSVFASLFYITAFTTNINAIQILISFFIVFIAVILPCCVSDIIFPLLFIKTKK